jgi:spoIIIJ-associated protein
MADETMEPFEAEGNTVDEALQRICEKLGVERADLDYEVLTHRKRLLGLIGRDEVLVRGWVKSKGSSDAVEFLNRIFQLSGTNCLAARAEEEETSLHIAVEGADVDDLIRRDGELLDSFQYLANKTAQRGGRRGKKIILDTGGFRARRREELQRLARQSAEKVRSSGRSVLLNPLNAHDRRIVHVELQDQEEVFTQSIGEGPFKKVMIAARKSDRPPPGGPRRL